MEEIVSLPEARIVMKFDPILPVKESRKVPSFAANADVESAAVRLVQINNEVGECVTGCCDRNVMEITTSIVQDLSLTRRVLEKGLCRCELDSDVRHVGRAIRCPTCWSRH
jgi:hypothetical protein